MSDILLAVTVAGCLFVAAACDKKAEEGRQLPEKGAAQKPTPPADQAVAKEAPDKEGRAAGAAAAGAAAAEAEQKETEEKGSPVVDKAEKKGGESVEKEKKGGPPIVRIETNLGNITVELTPDRTPVTVNNFLTYVRDGFFNGTVFHRVVKGFVIQGGGYTSDLALQPTKAPIANEAKSGLSNKRGTIAMARTNVRDSATSQFFINLRDNAMLDYRGESPSGWGYTAFGKVTEGMDVVEAIGALPTGPGGQFPAEVPKKTVIITKTVVVE
jgi:cyclophilin family peptidyl-prolyl cis-trans isomerase